MFEPDFIAQAGIVGFESPASQYEESSLNMNDLLIRTPSSTRLMLCEDNCLARFGIFKNDILIISEDSGCAHNQIIVGSLNGQPVFRYYDGKRRSLIGSMASQSYQLSDSDELCIHGIVKQSIRRHVISDEDLNLTTLDIQSTIVRNPSATYFGMAQGQSMMNTGIFDGDLLVVDRHQFIHDGAIIVATLNGEFVCKKIDKKQRRLISTKPYKAYQLSVHDRFQVEGCVIASIRMHTSLTASLN